MTTSSTTTNTNFEGVLLVDKPTGMTSHDVVDRLRRKLKMKRIGLLIMLVGKATKLSQYLMSLDKAYHGRIKLGESTNTYDCEGEVTTTTALPEDLTQASFEAVLADFKGDQYQMPPMFSAKKVNGVPLYKHARKGKEVEREPRFIRIDQLELRGFDLPYTDIFMTCSKGTYVRTLAHDIGEKIGCGAHLSELRRTASDRFRVEDAATLQAIEEMPLADLKRRLIPIYQAVPSHAL